MSQSDSYRILLLEDNSDYHWLFIHSLRRQAPQHTVDWVETLERAIELLGSTAYDAIVTDLNVPDSIGMEIVVALREAAHDTPIIALTGSDDEALEQEVLDHGGQDYLIKGNVAGRDISRAIHHAVERQQAVNKIRRLADDLSEPLSFGATGGVTQEEEPEA